MVTAALHGATVLASLARPGEPVSRRLFPLRLDLGPEIAPAVIKPVRESAVRSLGEDLLTAHHMDIGRYRAFVVQDPRDKRKVSGYFHMALIKYRTNHIRDWDGNPGWNSEPDAMPNVAEAVSLYTDIKMDVRDMITLDSEELFGLPFIFLTGEADFEWTEVEARNLGRYLRQGGFLMVDDSSDIPMIGSAFDRSARALLRAALGEDCRFEKIPNDHWLYHCFFDFNGPPVGFDFNRFARPVKAPYDFLEGIFLDGRLAVLYSNKAYGKLWDHAYKLEPEHGGPMDFTRQLQFGVNIIVFALTQPGGIVSQQMRYQD